MSYKALDACVRGLRREDRLHHRARRHRLGERRGAAPLRKGRRLFGRGAADMKSGLASML
jgi:arginine utilization protein RocB